MGLEQHSISHYYKNYITIVVHIRMITDRSKLGILNLAQKGVKNYLSFVLFLKGLAVWRTDIVWCRPGSEFSCWCRSRSGSVLASKRCWSSSGSYSKFTHVGKSEIFFSFFTFSHSITSLQCFIFLISVKYVIIFNTCISESFFICWELIR